MAEPGRGKPEKMGTREFIRSGQKSFANVRGSRERASEKEESVHRGKGPMMDA